MVIHAAQNTADFEVMPLEMSAAINFSRGITEWGGKELRSDLAHAVRLYPHQNDSGGFFFACLRKL